MKEAKRTPSKKGSKKIVKSEVTPSSPKKTPAKSPLKVLSKSSAKSPSQKTSSQDSMKKSTKPTRPLKKTKKEPEVHLVSEDSQKLKIVMVASECTPYAKSGGLADAIAGLSKALHEAGHSVRIVIPLYSLIDRAKWKIEFRHPVCIHMGGGEEQWVGLFEGLLDGKVPVWFVDYERFFARPGIYDHQNQEYPDNPYRFALLSKAAMQICKDTNFIPDVMHSHDWQGALVPAFLKTWDRVFSPLSHTASALTIHNIGYQGKFPASVWNYWGMGPEHFHADTFEDFGAVNMLKGGIYFADAITTVSPTHAREILEPIGGQGLAPAVGRRSEDFVGILNGVDTDHWNPSTDSLIPAPFDPTDLRGKLICKTALQKEFNLELRPDIPVFGLVSRFAHQKGMSLIQDVLPQVLDQMVAQFVFLGSGDPSTETWVVEMMARYPGKVGGYIGFSNQHAHLIEAGSDFFLMPSLYEPCGLNQIYSLKYGTPPLVRATGGLDDTVIAYNEADGSGTGFKFHEPIGTALLHTIGLVVATWYDRPHHIAQMRAAAMAQHFTWEDVLPEYLKMYRHAIHRRSLWI
jgi:starch synthase